MSTVIENATHVTLKHVLYRQTCNQNMFRITRVTNKHLYFMSKLYLMVTILKPQQKFIMTCMCLRHSSQGKLRIAPRQITPLHDRYLLIITVAMTYDHFPSVIKLIHSVCVLLFFALSFWQRKKWELGAGV